MEFASKFILFNEEDEYETISDEEMEQGMHVSDSESDEEDNNCGDLRVGRRSLNKKTKLKHHWKHQSLKDENERPQPPPALQDMSSGASSKVLNKHHYRRADTNIVSVNLNTLLSPGNMHAGEPVVCNKCQAILSHISKVDAATKIWQCEFCDEPTEVDVEPAEISKDEDVTFLLDAAMTTTTSTLSGVDQSLVVFCVDTSGSMCVTTEISGTIKLRGTSQLKRLQSFNEENDNQYLPSQRHRDVTYISRLQAMQAAVDHQLNQMSKDHPDRRVALIAFNNEVTIVGDGSQIETIVAGSKLTSEEQLCKIGSEVVLPKAIKASRKVLGEKVYSLEEGGATALGPALIVAVNMAAHHPGSKVILCTDGKANIGMGKLEDATEEQAALDFYTKTAQSALDKGVTVSVITIGGTDCKLVHLGTLADKTGGQVNIVDPVKLTEEFGNILADPLIATRVKATFILHKELFIIDENDPDSQLFRAERNVGNVRSTTTITFEFARRQHSKDLPASDQGATASSSADSDSEHGATAPSKLAMTDFPFQLQIEYTDTEGNKALRVITRTMPATTQRKMTEENANLNILGLHAAKKSAALALQGQFSKSRSVAMMNQRLAWRHSHSDAASAHDRKKYKAIYSKIQRMENTVHSKLKQEIQVFGHSRSDSEPSDEDESKHFLCLSDQRQEIGSATASLAPLQAKHTKGYRAIKFKKMHSKRSSDMDDGMANMMYRFRSVGANEISTLAISDETSSSRSGQNKAADKSAPASLGSSWDQAVYKSLTASLRSRGDAAVDKSLTASLGATGDKAADKSSTDSFDSCEDTAADRSSVASLGSSGDNIEKSSQKKDEM